MPSSCTPLLMIGAGNMGGALIAGWRRSGVVAAADLILRDPTPGEAARRAAAEGAALNGPLDGLASVRTVILAVKPQIWRGIAEDLAPRVARDAVVISIMAGVTSRDIAEVFPGRAVARVMPTTAAAVLKGAATLWTGDARARDTARMLFMPLGAFVEVAEEAQMHLATAASGSAPAYVYALVEALQTAGQAAGLPEASARALSRAALIGAAALLEDSGEEAAELRRQVTSPGGTTEAALRVLLGEGGLPDLLTRAVDAAARRSRELGA